ncbi:MAG: hypothetical protein ACRD6I_09485 [Candidatus Acidiferrales bacterium]
MPPRPASQTPCASRISSSSFHGGFTPGAVLVERYRIIGLLGRGGMGEVYRADDLKLGVPVALKFLPPAYERDPAFLERFLSEVRIARQVSHPNVCRVIFRAITQGLLNGMAFLGGFFIFRVVFRVQWLAVGAMTLLLSVLFVADVINIGVTLGFGLAVSALLMTVLLRFGLLAFTICWCTFLLNAVFYMPFDLSQSHGSNLLLPLGLIIGAALFGFYRSLGGRAVVGVALAED